MTAMTDFARAHWAVFMAVVGWNIITAVLTSVFKPQTPDQYARLALKHPRLADIWRAVGALGIDPVKFVLVLREVLRPELVPITYVPPPAPSPTTTKDDNTQ